MIELKGISRIYKPKKGVPVKALDQVTLSFGKTGMVFVLGKSGSGKSTLLNVVGGLDKFDSGELIIKGKTTSKFTQSDYDSYRNTMIGFIFQEYNVLDDFTVAQNIGIALELQGKKMTDQAINEILESVDLIGYGKRHPNELSGGQLQRVAIARALVKNPEIIMADEPTGALDSNTGRQVLETLQKLSKDRLVLVVSHDRDFAETYGTRIIEFKDGQVISDVVKEENLHQVQANLVYSDNKIEIKQGYRLTEEDVSLINAYLAQSRKDVTLERKFDRVSFVNTQVNDIELSHENYKLIKSKLPFKSSLKIGASSLKHKKFRLALSIILASLSFGLFGVSDAMGNYNRVTAAVNSISDTGINYVALQKMETITQDNYTYSYSVNLTDEDLLTLKSKFPSLNFSPVYIPTASDLNFGGNLNLNVESVDAYYYPKFAGYFEMGDTELDQFSNHLTGSLPHDFTEIAISKYTFEIFKKYGYRLDGNKVTITTENDLINKHLDLGTTRYKIVGIVDTSFPENHFQSLKDVSEITLPVYLLRNELMLLLTYSQHGMVYVKKGFITANNQEKGVLNGGRYYFSLTGLDDDRDAYYYVNRVKKKSDLNLGNVAPLKNVNLTSLTKSQVILDYLSIAGFFSNELNSRLDTFVNTYITNEVDLEIIRTDLEIIDPVSSWSLAMKEDYQSQFKDKYYQDEFAPVPPSGLKTFKEIQNLSIRDFFENLAPFSLNFTVWDNFVNIPNSNNVEVVGVNLDNQDDYNQASLFLIDGFFDELDLVEDGPYSSTIAYLDSDNHSVIRSVVLEHYKKAPTNFSLRNEVIQTLDVINDLFETLARVFLIIGTFFAVFASLLLFNYISTSISYKKQEIGILRAIGARSNDVFSIFFLESSIIALINFVIANIAVVTAIVIINNAMRVQNNLLITLLTYSFRQFILLFGLSLLVAFVSSILPVSRIARKRPIDAIRNR